VTNIICRYMQVHSDVGGSPKLIRQVAFRRNGAAAAQPNGTRILDMEMRLGHSVDWNRVTYVFAGNWIGQPTLCLPRQTVNIGPLVSTANPAPFEMVVPLPTPFPYTGATSLAFEMIQHSNTANGLTAQHDNESGSSTTGAAASVTGPGCIATGRSSTMDLVIQHGDRGGAYQCGAYVTLAPANAPTTIYFGASNLNIPVPGLCGNILHDFAFPVPVGLSDASGFIGEYATSTTSPYPSALCTIVMPNTIGGATLYAQAHSLDVGRVGQLPICNSIGRTFTVPMPNTTVVAKASRLYNFQLQGPTHPHATPLSLAHGYTAVTEFTY
jgi:hypothetical protein